MTWSYTFTNTVRSNQCLEIELYLWGVTLCCYMTFYFHRTAQIKEYTIPTLFRKYDVQLSLMNRNTVNSSLNVTFSEDEKQTQSINSFKKRADNLNWYATQTSIKYIMKCDYLYDNYKCLYFKYSPKITKCLTIKLNISNVYK